MGRFSVLHLLFCLSCRPTTGLSPENQNRHSENAVSGHSPSPETRNLRRKPDPSNLEASPLTSRSLEEDSRRTSLRTRTTLLNVNIQELTPEEIIFFEDTWVQTFNNVLLGGENVTIHENSSSPRLRSFVVEEVLEGNVPNHGRSLASTAGRTRGGATSSKWFDIWALLETSCRLCSHDDYRGRVLTGLTMEGSSAIQDLEATLCDALRQSSFASFQNLQQCRIVYLDE